MPRTQRTFSIIPDGASIAAAAAGVLPPTTTSTRPMTSKQVRKAYRSRTRGPTMSKAERLLWERREQERIRKELERERTAAKAKALRERRREREREEREEKRRNGMPLVSVRPSQDTISRFVRGVGIGGGKKNGEGATRHLTPIGEGEDELGLGDDGAEIEWSEPGSRRSASPVPIPGDTGNIEVKQEMVEQEEEKAAITPKVEPTGRDCDLLLLEGFDFDSNDDDYNYDDININILEGFELDSDDDYDLDILWEPIRVPKNPNPQDTSPNNPPADIDLLSEEDDLELEMLALDTTTTSPIRQPIPRPSTHLIDKILHPTAFEKDLGLDKRISSAPRRDPRPETPTNPPKQLEPPLSTQAIFSNVDDFFPTASQLERELRGDACPSGSGFGFSREISSPGSPKRFFASFSDDDDDDLSFTLSPPKRKRRSPSPTADKRPVAALPPPPPPPPPNRLPLTQRNLKEQRRRMTGPPPSQESFDGDWLDDAACELLV